MKIIFNDSPQEITHYEIVHGLTLLIIQGENNLFTAYFDKVAFKDNINDDSYRGVTGTGDSVDSALENLCEELNGKCIVYNAFRDNEECYKIPPLKHTLKVFG